MTPNLTDINFPYDLPQGPSGAGSPAEPATAERLAAYADLLALRDQRIKEADSYQIRYTREFGEMIVANFELKIACIREKKTISYCRRRINRGLPVDTARMKDEIEQEMQLYRVQLQELIQETDDAKQAREVGRFELMRARKIYRRLTKLLHPDINPKTSESEELQDLWARICEAYRHTDVDELENLEVLARKLTDGLDAAVDAIPDLDLRYDRLERQINEIVTTEPYIYGELLADHDRKEGLRAQLQAEHDNYEEYLKTLQKTLEDTLLEGGARMVWTAR